jgi:Ca-activated chloride channel homolog
MKHFPASAAMLLLLTHIACNNHQVPSHSKTEGKFTSPIVVADTKSEEAPQENKLDEVVVLGYAQNAPPQPGKSARALKGAVADVVREQELNTEDYDNIIDNRFQTALRSPLSTFSIDVDAASYSNIRRYIENGSLPPAGAVRIEEMINYFDYSYEQPKSPDPFLIHTEMSLCPWNHQHRLVHIGLQGKKIEEDKLPDANLVFLIDVSGSMDEENKLPLVKTSLKMLADRMRANDRVALVVYAGSAGLVLPSTSGSNKAAIKEAIDRLEAGGSTAGGEGLQLAYEVAKKNFIKEGNNRVILATDGDFNVGPSSDDDMVRLIEKERTSGVYLSVLGFGMGNYKDNKMQQLADKGNGNHYYIDNISEAKKIFIKEFGSTIYTIAEDVKIQIEFNPALVQGYRLIGYENRMLAAEDFHDDKKDAGELGSGHAVTALYEIIPAGVVDTFLTKVDSLKFQTSTILPFKSKEIMTLKLRYKNPGEKTSHLIEQTVTDRQISIANTSNDFRFSAAVASFGMLLRNSPYKQQSSFNQVLELARSSMGEKEDEYKTEFVALVKKASALVKNDATVKK